MKYILSILILLPLIFASCGKKQLKEAEEFIEGTWVVNLYFENGIDQTADFEQNNLDRHYQFSADGTYELWQGKPQTPGAVMLSNAEWWLQEKGDALYFSENGETKKYAIFCLDDTHLCIRNYSETTPKEYYLIPAE